MAPETVTEIPVPKTPFALRKVLVLVGATVGVLITAGIVLSQSSSEESESDNETETSE